MPVSGQKRNLVDSVSLGSPLQKMAKEHQTIQFVIHGFEGRSERCGEPLESRVLRAHGYLWKIWVYPKGHRDSNPEIDYVGCYLTYSRKNKLPEPGVKFAIRCKERSLDHKTIVLKKTKLCGWHNFLPRDYLLENYLEEDGSLVIEADIWIATNTKLTWYPKKIQPNKILVELYCNANSQTADVLFTVEGKEYHAHTAILSMTAKALFELSKGYKNDGPILINGISSGVFGMVLEYVYTVKTPDIKDDNMAMDILVAADRFDCTHLKLYVESYITDKFLEASNAAKLMVFADSHLCALLKEAAMDLYKTTTTVVRASQSWSKVRESPRLTGELLDHLPFLFLTSSDLAIEYSCDDVDRLDVASLRNQLQEANIKVDGSRKILVHRLKEHITS